MNIPTDENGEWRPPITLASRLLLDYIELPSHITKEFALSACRYYRKQRWIWQREWWYWNRVLTHIKSWDGEFPK